VITNVPEPSTIIMLLGAAATGLGGMVWRRRRKQTEELDQDLLGV